MMNNAITLEQVMQTLINSQRMLVMTEDGEELYRGYVANFMYCDVDRAQEVKEVSLATDIFRKEKRDARLFQTEGRVEPVDNETDFKFSDLEILIYQKIVLRKEQKNS